MIDDTFKYIAVVSAISSLIAPSSAWAGSNAMPEILLVVDSSQSMQYRVGADKLPICGSVDKALPDEKSRWNVVREIIGGSFSAFQCKYEDLPAMPEAIAPPKQLFGNLQCIPGVAMSLGQSYAVNPQSGQPADKNSGTVSAAGVTYGDELNLVDTSQLATRKIPWIRLDLASIPTGGTWGGAGLSLQTSALGKDAGMLGQLVLMTKNPDYDPPKEVACSVSTDGQIALSGPTVINAAGTTVFGISVDGAKKLQDIAIANAKAGTAPVYLAIVPASSHLDAACQSVTGTATNQVVQWSGASAVAAIPVLKVNVGIDCPGEGPSKHSIALGVDGLGVVGDNPNSDGLLDIFKSSCKFALLDADHALSTAVDAKGGFSFGSKLASMWGDANTGIADPYAVDSTSVPITNLDNKKAILATYTAIHSALTGIRPNGPTTLGQQLEDVVDYIGPGKYMDNHFKTAAEDPAFGDPYLACRTKLVAVFTDGGANLYSGAADGRIAAIQAAAKLYAQDIKVFVFAVGHPSDGSSAGPSAADLQFLNDLAVAGGTLAATPVVSASQVQAALKATINASASAGEALTRPTFSYATGLVSDVQHGFDALSNFDASAPFATSGVLEQRIFRCDASCKSQVSPNRAQVCDILNYSDRLVARSLPRKIFTQKGGVRVTLDGTNVSADDLAINNAGTGAQLLPQADGSCPAGVAFDLSIDSQRDNYRDHIFDTLLGKKGTCRQLVPLGAPGHAQPAVLDPADRLGLRDPSFLSYAKANTPSNANYSVDNPPGSALRPTLLFAATHDGLLHAFRTDANPKIKTSNDQAAGDELWAFMPKFNLKRLPALGLVTIADASFLGGAVVAAHVLLERDSAATAAAAKNWRAVVLAGAGEGGSGYIALDVTAPEDPRLLWEITPARHCYGAASVGGVAGPACVDTKKFAGMGRSTAKPLIASMFYHHPGGNDAEHAVAIIPYGKPPADASVLVDPTKVAEGNGDRGVMVLDLSNGDIVRIFTGADLKTDGITATMSDTKTLGKQWSSMACYNSAPGQITTRCFVGDSKGMLWRLDLSSPDPALWKMSFFFDAYGGGQDVPASLQFELDSPNRVPVLSAPSLATSADGNLRVVYGTGGVDEETSNVRHSVVYSLSEHVVVAGNGEISGVSADRNWVKILSDYERFVGPPLIFGGNAYWSTYATVKDSACSTGKARLYGAKYDRPVSVSDPTTLQGAFENPAKPGTISANLLFNDIGSYKPSPVDVLPVPACSGTCPPADTKCVIAAGGQLGGARPKYELGVAVPGGVQSAYQAPKGSSPPAAVGTISREMPQPRTSAVITGWDLLLD